MTEHIDKKQFLASMGLTGDETKYGNRDAEHQHRSYSSYMSYEIMDCVDDSIVEEELVPVVRCKDCKHWKKGGFMGGDTPDSLEYGGGCPLVRFARYESDFCSKGERKDGE